MSLTIERCLMATLRGALLAAMGNALIYVVANAFGIGFRILQVPQLVAQPVELLQITLTTIIPAPLAGFIYYWLGSSKRGKWIFALSSAVIFLVSLLGPLTVRTEGGIWTRMVLVLMHTVAAGAIVGRLLVDSQKDVHLFSRY